MHVHDRDERIATLHTHVHIHTHAYISMRSTDKCGARSGLPR